MDGLNNEIIKRVRAYKKKKIVDVFGSKAKRNKDWERKRGCSKAYGTAKKFANWVGRRHIGWRSKNGCGVEED